MPTFEWQGSSGQLINTPFTLMEVTDVCTTNRDRKQTFLFPQPHCQQDHKWSRAQLMIYIFSHTLSNMILRRLALIGCFRASCVNSYQRGCNGKQMSTLPTEVSTSVNCQSDAVNWSDGHFAQCICGVSCALRVALFGSRTSGVTRCKGGGRSNRSPNSSLFFLLSTVLSWNYIH